MAAMAVAECLDSLPREQWSSTPLLLCVAERDRPGRLEGLDEELLRELEEELDAKFAPASATIPHGRVSVAIALLNARKLLHGGNATRVVIVATDTFIVWPTLAEYQDERRLLSPVTSNGFIPGEGAGAVLVTLPTGRTELLCTGTRIRLGGRAHPERGAFARRGIDSRDQGRAVRRRLRDARSRLSHHRSIR